MAINFARSASLLFMQMNNEKLKLQHRARGQAMRE